MEVVCQVLLPFVCWLGYTNGLTAASDTGWTIGDIGSDARWCQKLAVEANAAVFDIGYRLAPEHKFPVAIEDSWKALTYVSLADFIVFSVVQTSDLGILFGRYVKMQANSTSTFPGYRLVASQLAPTLRLS